MNDEATTHFASIIDNMEFGMNWLRDNLGRIVCPKFSTHTPQRYPCPPH